jgi:phenylalanyl-tRNA synthetase beta chain
MKVSLNLAQYYSNVDLKQLPHDEILTRIGAQLGAVEEVIDWGARYDNVFVVKVEECVAHPDSDHMHVCKINDGGVAENIERDERGFITVVCGAPNIAAGQLVVWLAPGSTVPSSYDEQEKFVLGSREAAGYHEQWYDWLGKRIMHFRRA